MIRVLQVVLRGKNRAEPALSSLVNHYSTASDSQRLAGKVAVITGAASGIGKATAAEFVRNGAKVILADVQDDLGRAVAAELGPDAAYTRCDVTDEAQVAAAVDLAVARHGRLDIVFNNAGVSGNLTPTPLGSLDLADFDRVAAVNTRAVLAGVKHAARVMVPRRSGSILCTASTAGVLGAAVADLGFYLRLQGVEAVNSISVEQNVKSVFGSAIKVVLCPPKPKKKSTRKQRSCWIL